MSQQSNPLSIQNVMNHYIEQVEQSFMDALAQCPEKALDTVPSEDEYEEVLHFMDKTQEVSR